MYEDVCLVLITLLLMHEIYNDEMLPCFFSYNLTSSDISAFIPLCNHRVVQS